MATTVTIHRDHELAGLFYKAGKMVQGYGAVNTGPKGASVTTDTWFRVGPDANHGQQYVYDKGTWQATPIYLAQVRQDGKLLFDGGVGHQVLYSPTA